MINPSKCIKIFFVFGLLFITHITFSQAQPLSIDGIIKDSKSKPLIGATVRVLTIDSAFIKGSVTNEEGVFKIEDLKPGAIIIKITYLGYKDLYINKRLTDFPLPLGTLILDEKSSTLKEAVVNGEVKMAEQKGDTPNIIQELLKPIRMPQPKIW